MKRTCYLCKTPKRLDEFPTDRSKPLGRGYRCKTCKAELDKARQKTRPIAIREKRGKHWKTIGGITREAYSEKLAAQGGGCAICGKKRRKNALAVDHDHTTGAVRGLLCIVCNSVLGVFNDDPARIQKAVDYLRSYQSLVPNTETEFSDNHEHHDDHNPYPPCL